MHTLIPLSRQQQRSPSDPHLSPQTKTCKQPDMIAARHDRSPLGPDLFQSLAVVLSHCIQGGMGLRQDQKGREGLGQGEGH